MNQRIITDINEISLITKLVLTKMGEPGLESKVADTRILDDDSYDKAYGKNSGGITLVMESDDRKIRLNLIMLKQRPFRTLFPAYLHELGHVANIDHINSFGLQKYHMQVYAETLAFAFEGYAKETYNETEKGYFQDATDRRIITACLKFCSESDELGDVHKKAYTVLYRLFAATSPEYPDGLLKTYKEAYTALRNVPPIMVSNGTILN